jgi:hypothetical protein
MRLRIVGTDLPGSTCDPGDGSPTYEHVHVGVQRRERPAELLDLVPGDAPSAVWEISCDVVDRDGRVDFTGPYVSGRPGARFVYLSWGTLDADTFTMFRRAKLWLSGVLDDLADGPTLLEGRLGLTDAAGCPRCASVRPPLITWSAPPGDTNAPGSLLPLCPIS